MTPSHVHTTPALSAPVGSDGLHGDEVTRRQCTERERDANGAQIPGSQVVIERRRRFILLLEPAPFFFVSRVYRKKAG